MATIQDFLDQQKADERKKDRKERRMKSWKPIFRQNGSSGKATATKSVADDNQKQMKLEDPVYGGVPLISDTLIIALSLPADSPHIHSGFQVLIPPPPKQDVVFKERSKNLGNIRVAALFQDIERTPWQLTTVEVKDFDRKGDDEKRARVYIKFERGKERIWYKKEVFDQILNLLQQTWGVGRIVEMLHNGKQEFVMVEMIVPRDQTDANSFVRLNDGDKLVSFPSKQMTKE